MPAVPTTPRVKLRTTSRRVPRARSAEAAVDEVAEPSMRLSRALLVMLLLHVVAVGGFLASSVLRERGSKHSNGGSSTTALEAEDSQLPAKGDNANSRKAPVLTSPRGGVHIVRPGETLTLIANENGVTLESLVAANGADTVTNGLKTGQQLKLPDRSPDPSTVTVPTVMTNAALNQIEGRAKVAATPAVTNQNLATKSKIPAADTGKFYVVAKGDNAVTIAQKNKVSAESLLKLNGIDDPKKLRPGQKLRLPPVPTKSKAKQT